MGNMQGEARLWTKEGQSQTHRILLVDDEPRLREAFSRLLRADNREVQTAATGQEAIETLLRGGVDVVVLDLGLPDMSGIQVMERMGELNIDASVIVFSANDDIDSAILALRRGAFEFIRKPCEPEELAQTVDNALELRFLERSHALLQSRVEQSERLHRFLVDNSPDIIYTLDGEGRFVFMNSRAEGLLGYNRKELIGQHYSVIVHEEDQEKARYGFNERRIGDRATNNMEVRLRCKNEAYRHFENHTIVVMLCALGIYDDQEGGVDHGRRFQGTYGVARDITERKKAEELISFQAYHDQLTHLPNRALLQDRLTLALTQARRDSGMLAIMYIDLDRFKLVNDTYGHAMGDELLKAIAQRIRACLRASDTLSRHGGDEFIVLLPDVGSEADALMVAEKILSTLQLPFTLMEREFNATVSIGLAFYPGDDETSEGLLRKADIAMYQVKIRGKNGCQRYQREMSVNHDRRVAFENDLREALVRKEFFVLYQPQVDARTRQLIGVEALIRWQHPVYGLLSPGDFISVAEESGFIEQISDWVLDQGCAQLRQWQALGHTDLKLAVNISPQEFNQGRLGARLMQALQTHQVPAHTLEIEITENLLLDDAERVIGTVRELRKHGLHIAVDDFGTRYSSLNYLRRFAISRIKIDKSFIRDLGVDDGAHSIVHAILGIARGMGLQVLAEGVESDAQLQILLALGCHEMQGYLFSKPAGADAITAMLQQPLAAEASAS
jgi:diguanylate cyclase (GGDEF)-like protein/PAS domain S-box-containing protein